jgi:hypothetical protein
MFFSEEPFVAANPTGGFINLDPFYFAGVPNWATTFFDNGEIQNYACKKAATVVAG